MKIIGREEALRYICKDMYVQRDGSFEVSVINADGSRPSSAVPHGDVDLQIRINPDNMKLVVAATWDSPFWKERGESYVQPDGSIDQDWLAVFQVSNGLAVFTFTASGISSVTIDNIYTNDFMPKGTFEAVLNMCFDDGNRRYAEAAFAQLVVSDLPLGI